MSSAAQKLAPPAEEAQPKLRLLSPSSFSNEPSFATTVARALLSVRLHRMATGIRRLIGPSRRIQVGDTRYTPDALAGEGLDYLGTMVGHLGIDSRTAASHVASLRQYQRHLLATLRVVQRTAQEEFGLTEDQLGGVPANDTPGEPSSKKFNR